MQRTDWDSLRKKLGRHLRPIRMIEGRDKIESSIQDIKDDIRKQIQESTKEIARVKFSKKKQNSNH